MRLTSLGLFVGLLAAGCASSPRTSGSEVAMILWPRAEAACDFEDPDRATAWALSTSPTSTAIVRGRGRAATTYVARDVQLISSPVDGDRLCLTVVRGLTWGEKDAVFGFDVQFRDRGSAELSPAYVRLTRSANGTRRPTAVRIAFGSARVVAGETEPTGFVEFDLGVVGSESGAAPPPTGAGMLLIPSHVRGGLTRLVTVVEEATPGSPSSLSRDFVDQALSQTDPRY